MGRSYLVIERCWRDGAASGVETTTIVVDTPRPLVATGRRTPRSPSQRHRPRQCLSQVVYRLNQRPRCRGIIVPIQFGHCGKHQLIGDFGASLEHARSSGVDHLVRARMALSMARHRAVSSVVFIGAQVWEREVLWSWLVGVDTPGCWGCDVCGIWRVCRRRSPGRRRRPKHSQ